VTVGAELQGGWWLLRVTDTGRGMTEDQLQHLFEPFNRLGAERDGPAGTGIGLAIVQASMQHMGGTVQVRSTPGEGSVFELALQQSAEPQSAALAFAPGTPLPPAPPVPGSHRPLLLYIEDNDVNMLIVRELVRQRPDLDFEGAVDGASGLAAARRLQPALILLDMQLPDTNGHAVLRQLRTDPATAQIRCIALSANAMPEDIRIALAEGFDDYWTKPLDLTNFLRALEALFGKAPAAAA
jgi:CheY-like chemotaxis protein